MAKWYERFNDSKFTHYILSGEAEAVYIVRDKAAGINTNGKWIDILNNENNKNGDNFRIRCELFPRITHPQYIENDNDYNRYICWKAAHEDIAKHRKLGHRGERFVVNYRRITKRIRNSRTGEIETNNDYTVTSFKKL